MRRPELWLLKFASASLVLFCLSFAAQAQELASAKKIRELPLEQAKLQPAVRLRGQVLVLSGWKNSFFLSDGSAGISVDRNDSLPELHAGDQVEVIGNAAPGAFAPVIISSRIRVLGRQKLPPAPLRAYSDLAGGVEDSQWLQVRGVARAAWIAQSWNHKVLFIDIDLGGGEVIARVQNFSVPDPSFLVDAEVRVRGVCGTNFNQRRQLVGLRLFVADMDAVTVEEPAPKDPFLLPFEKLEGIQRFSPLESFRHRQHVLGTVTYQNPGEGLYIQDDKTGLYIETRQTTPVSVGDRIDAVGFAGAGSYSPHLRGALFRVLEAGTPPQPIALTAHQLITTNADGFSDAPYDGLLVSLRGRLIEQVSGSSQYALVLREDDQVFRAYLSKQSAVNDLRKLSIGSDVKVTGVVTVESDGSGEPRSFTLKLRTEDDVLLLRPPPWWETRRILYLWILAFLAVAGSLFGMVQSRQRLRRQAERIRELEQALATRERRSLPIEAPLRRWAAGGFAIAVLLTSLLALLSWMGSRQAEQSDYGVAHTNAVLEALATTSGHLVQLETSGRAFSLSGQPALLDRYARGEESVPRDLEELRNLTADNPEQQRRLVFLQQAAGEAASFAARIVARRQLGPYQAGDDAVTMERIINRVDSRLRELREEEKRLLKERTARSKSNRHSTAIMTVLGMLLGVGLLVTAGIAIRREINLNAMARAQTDTLNAELRSKSAALQSEVAERKLAEEALVISDAKRSFALGTAKLGEWSLDLATGKATCSLRHYEIFGYKTPPPEWNLERFLSHVNLEDHGKVRELFQRCALEKAPFNLEAKIVTLGGETRWIWSCGDWELGSKGEPVALAGIIADITDRKRAEQELANVKFALDQHAIVAITDVRGRILYANERFCTISASSYDELVGQNHRIFHSDHHGKEFFKEMYRIVAAGNVWHGEIQNCAKDGSLYWVDTTIVPFMNAGKYSQYIAIGTDITERKRAELMRERLTAAAVEGSDDAMISIALDATIHTWNKGAERIFGYRRDEAIGKSMLMLLPEERQQEEPAILARIACGESLDHFETARLRSDRSQIDVSVTVSPIRDMRGAIIGAFKIARDVTKSKAAELEITKLNEELRHRNQTLEQSNMELQQFAYIASHDLQSPLRSISGFLELLKMEYEDKLDARGCEWIGRTSQAIKQMQALIRDILAYSRVDSRSLPFASVSLGEVLQDAIDLLDSSVRDSGGRVTSDELPVVAGDRSQLVQLMQNLIGNSLTYRSKEPPHIHVTAERTGQLWEIAVRDNGIGIEPKYHERIFEIFKRLQHQKDYPGTGIGLAVCRRVVERHGGRIWVESEPGRGSTFLFTIPKRTDNIDEQSTSKIASSTNSSRRG